MIALCTPQCFYLQGVAVPKYQVMMANFENPARQPSVRVIAFFVYNSNLRKVYIVHQYQMSLLVMGQGQKILTLIMSIFLLLGSGQPSLD